MDATWDMVLVGASLQNEAPLRCPESAPNEGFSGNEVGGSQVPPLRVIGCSANPEPTCDSPTAVCMPFEPSFLPCVVRDGKHTCRGAYSEGTTVVDENANILTVCCEKESKLT